MIEDDAPWPDDVDAPHEEEDEPKPHLQVVTARFRELIETHEMPDDIVIVRVEFLVRLRLVHLHVGEMPRQKVLIGRHFRQVRIGRSFKKNSCHGPETSRKPDEASGQTQPRN